MRIPRPCVRLRSLLGFGACLLLGASAGAQPAVLWEAFNDHRPTPGVTSENATGWDMRTGAGGTLKNILTGEDLPGFFSITTEGGAPDDFGANSKVNAGSPAYKLFNGKVDIGNDGIPGVRHSTAAKLIINFGGLDPAKRYRFRGTASRGGGYNDRWTVYSITGTEVYVAAHEDGSNNRNIITAQSYPAAAADLLPNQVALNTGDNKAGSLVGWNDIAPSPDGTFNIEAEQYVGKAPFGNPAAGPYGYGFSAMYLAEVEATGNLRITANPVGLKAPAGKAATFTVGAESTQPIQYQWQAKAPGGDTFADIPGATSATYTTAALVTGQDGTVLRCQIKSGADKATSDEVVLNVDGVIPTIASVSPSINFNAVYVTFSEPMDLDQLALADNYKLSGGLTVDAAAALDSTTVHLTTSAQAPGTAFTLTVNNVADLAGNPVRFGSTADFTSYTRVKGVAGLELFYSVLGGAVADLRNSPKYPAAPDADFVVSAMDSLLVLPDGSVNAYGGRMRAWLTPPESGDYEFFLSADDQGEFRISFDDTFDNIELPDNVVIVNDTTGGDGFQESGSAATSAPITLEGGHAYPIQVLWKETNGGDQGRLAWRVAGDPTPAAELQPISGDVLAYYGAASRLTTIVLQDGKVAVDWAGAALESSEDLVTWTPVAGAASPYVVAPAGRLFFRAR